MYVIKKSWKVQVLVRLRASQFCRLWNRLRLLDVLVCVCVYVRELRLTEAIHEPHICENILQYNVHAERKGSLRYAKGMSETMQTLHGLVYVYPILLVFCENS